MTTLRWFCAAALSLALTAPAAVAQDGPKPGPEHDYLKKHAGTWDLTMKFGGMAEMLSDPESDKARRAMRAMLGMKKIDLAELKRAYAG